MSKAAVFNKAGQPLELTSFDLPQSLPPGSAICRVTMSTICGSDLHTISGRRIEPAPLILGHEIIGEIFALGDGLTHDGFGQPLAVGDRVTWTIMACCGECFFCTHDLPNKCVALKKYGHTCCKEAPPLTGGFAEHVVLWPGTGVFRIPDNLPDEIATPANCALATVVCATDTVGVAPGETALIQGAGLLGLNLVALCKEAECENVLVTDVQPERLELAKRFGATACVNLREGTDEDLAATARSLTDGRGVDVAFEVCGRTDAIASAVGALRTGGRYLIAGLVMAGSLFELDGNDVTRKVLTIKGIHNYAGRHLGDALAFLSECAERYPYDEIVGARFSLDQINDAVAEAATGRHIRVAVR